MKFLLKQKKRSAVSPVIATLLLIAIAVAAAIIVYAFVTGLIGGLSSGSGSSLVPVTASLLVPTGTSPGTVAISVQNTANNPITGISVLLNTGAGTGVKDANGLACMGETPAGAYCNAVVGAACPSAVGDPATFCNSASLPIDTANALPVGSQVSASVGVQSNGASILQSGSTYSFTITCTFANGSTQTQVVSTAAQL
jgi:flagellin-like protein